MKTVNQIRQDELDEFINPEERLEQLELDIEEKDLVSDSVDLSDKLTLAKIKKEVARKHTVKYENDEVEYYPICCTDTGIFGCGRERNRSELQSYGLGIVNYFKIIKAYFWVFFIALILNLFMLVIYTQSHPERSIHTYQEAIFKTTIGNIAASTYNCLKINFSDFEKKSNYRTILNCNEYDIASINYFGIPIDRESESQNEGACVNYQNSQNLTISNECSFAFNITSLAKTCIEEGESYCEFDIPTREYIDNCNNPNKFSHIYLGYTCLNDELPLIKWTMTRDQVSFIVVILDILTVLLIFISNIVIDRSIKINAINYDKETNQISDYTIHITKFNSNNQTIYKDLDDLVAHLNKIFEKEIKEFNANKYTNIYEINYPILTDEKLDLVLEENKMQEEINHNKKKIIKNDFDEEQKLKVNNKIADLGKKIEEIKKKNMENDKELYRIDDAWITFNKMKYKHLIEDTYKRYNKCERCCLICCFQREKINDY